MTRPNGDPGRTLILGAGPTGLGAAYRFQELGFDDYRVLESGANPGGLASSVVDSKGFTWDLGGHVQFSHYPYYDRVLDVALGNRWLTHERAAWIWLKKRFIPYPIQNNIHRLDPADRNPILTDLEHLAGPFDSAKPHNFDDWIVRTFGKNLAQLFMAPYNLKVWAHPLESMSSSWVGDRVAVPDVQRIVENIALSRDETGWGPNQRFRFPLRGGTGAIWHAIAQRIPSNRLHFGQTVVGIELDSRNVLLADGRRLAYDTLVTTIPLDHLCRIATPLPTFVRSAAARLLHNSVHVLGVGLRGGKHRQLSAKCWIYFPEPCSPYYRVTIFSNYSPHNVPDGDDHWSLLAEVSESSYRPVDGKTILKLTLDAMRADNLLTAEAQIVSLWQRRLDYGYPIPSLDRDSCLDSILSTLNKTCVYSRGRFGGWKYEVSNQDHCFMQGIELVNWLLKGEPEVTLFHPAQVNARRSATVSAGQGRFV